MNKRRVMEYLRAIRRKMPVVENLSTIIVWRPNVAGYVPLRNNRVYLSYNFSIFEFTLSGRLLTTYQRDNPDHMDFARAFLSYHRIEINAPT